MAEQKQRRRRGVVLTIGGYLKLQAARLASEQFTNFGVRYTNEELRALTGLSLMTLAKIFTGTPNPTIAAQIPIDKSTIDRCFSAFNLTLERSDYFYTDNTNSLPPTAVISIVSSHNH
jgi:hypothetical protein